MARAELEVALTDGSSPARVRELLAVELQRSAEELAKPRAGREAPLTVAFAPGAVAVIPVPVSVRTDVEGDRLAGVVLAALLDEGKGEALAGDVDGWLALSVVGDADWAAAVFDDIADGVDRLRARALVVPALHALELRPLPAPREDDGVRPHDDPDPARAAARRILQTLRGKSKWGANHHTEFSHVQRGFEGNERRRATEVGEALLAAGLLGSMPAGGQRHVYLNPSRKADIDRLIESGELPDTLTLPFI